MLAISLRPEKGETRINVGGLYPKRMYLHAEDLPSFPMRVVLKIDRNTFQDIVIQHFPKRNKATDWVIAEVDTLRDSNELYLIMPFISVPGEVLYTYFTKVPAREVYMHSNAPNPTPTIPFPDGSPYKIYFEGEDCTNLCGVCFRKCRLPGNSSINCLFSHAFMSSAPENVISEEIIAYDMHNAILTDGTVVEHGIA